MSQVITLPWTIPDNVQVFAESQGVAPFLPSMLEATERVFPNARRRAVVLEEDPEIANLHTIVIEVDVPLSIAGSLAARRRWNEATLQCCPSTLICTFCLSIDLVE